MEARIFPALGLSRLCRAWRAQKNKMVAQAHVYKGNRCRAVFRSSLGCAQPWRDTTGPVIDDAPSPQFGASTAGGIFRHFGGHDFLHRFWSLYSSSLRFCGALARDGIFDKARASDRGASGDNLAIVAFR